VSRKTSTRLRRTLLLHFHHSGDGNEASKASSPNRPNVTHHDQRGIPSSGSLVFDAEHPLYYQALPVIHQCSLDGTITPVEQNGGQSDYRWVIGPSFTAANDPDTITLTQGDDTQTFETEYVMFNNLKMAWTIAPDGSASPVTGEFGYFGRQMTPNTKTAGQALHSGLEIMNGKLTRLFLDTTWAGVGGTEITSTLRGAEIEIRTGNEPKFFGSANKYFDSHGEGVIGATVTLTLEGNSSADAIYDLYQAGTEQALRIQVNGSQIGSGTTYKYQMDLFGYFQEVVPLGENVGSNNLHQALFIGKEDSSGNFYTCDIVTNHNTV